MSNPAANNLAVPTCCLLTAALLFLATLVASADWQMGAGVKPSFEVASIRQDISKVFTPPSYDLGAEDLWADPSGIFRSEGSLLYYIEFAYKIWPSGGVTKEMLAHLPKWATADKYLIEARAEGKPTKDQVRLMMRSLLAERFGLKLHFETETLPVLAMRLVEPGKLGPMIRPHSQAPPCGAPEPPPLKDGSRDLSTYPYVCGVSNAMDRPDRGVLLGSRNISPALMASSFGSLGWVEQTVVDQTGLSGSFDYTLEWTKEPPPSSSTDGDPSTEPLGTSFFRALKDQLGMKLEPTKFPVQVLIVDHVERPSEN